MTEQDQTLQLRFCTRHHLALAAISTVAAGLTSFPDSREALIFTGAIPSEANPEGGEMECAFAIPPGLRPGGFDPMQEARIAFDARTPEKVVDITTYRIQRVTVTEDQARAIFSRYRIRQEGMGLRFWVSPSALAEIGRILNPDPPKTVPAWQFWRRGEHPVTTPPDPTSKHEFNGEINVAVAVCGAKLRGGGTCQDPPIPGRNRCRIHGGASTGPKSEEGKARIAHSNVARLQ